MSSGRNDPSNGAGSVQMRTREAALQQGRPQAPQENPDPLQEVGEGQRAAPEVPLEAGEGNSPAPRSQSSPEQERWESACLVLQAAKILSSPPLKTCYPKKDHEPVPITDLKQAS